MDKALTPPRARHDLVQLLATVNRAMTQKPGGGVPGGAGERRANELYVALDTVKKHVTHIFEKLGAANRTEATARARELGLLAGVTEPHASFQS